MRPNAVRMQIAMSVEVRVPEERDREAIARLLNLSMNSSMDRMMARVPTFRLEDLRGAYDDGRLVSMAGELHFRQWFGGRSLPMSGIFGVATEPERRSSGLATACVRSLLERARDRGDPLSALYPAVLRPYRRLGYELAGTFTKHRLSLEAIPADLGTDLATVEQLDLDRDLEDLKSCYRRWARGHTGTIEPEDSMWTTRLLTRPAAEPFRAVVVRGGDGIEGFAAFHREPTSGPLDVAFGLACTSFVAETGRALRSLLGYFRGHRGIGRWVEWVGPPGDPMAFVVEELPLETSYRYPWMLRLLDVPAAFEQRGYPAEDGECTIAVEDPTFTQNAGPWRIRAERGIVTVVPADTAPPQPIPIGALSAMFTGFLRPADAVRLGHLRADEPSVEVFTRLLAGPAPWCPIFF
jgi:predicted acetyltransferase